MTASVNRPVRRVSQTARPLTVGWVFMRLSGLALIFLALGHFGIQHVINDVHDLSLAFVAERWSSLGWRIYDALLLGLGLVHGLNGLRIVADDYIHRPALRNVVRAAIIVVGTVLTIIGVWTVIGGVTPLAQ